MEKYISIDTETTGLRPFHGDKPFLIGYFDGVRFSYNKTEVKKKCEDKKLLKVFANAKFDIHMLRTIGINVQGPVADILVMNHLLTGDGKASLKSLAHTILKEKTDDTKLNEWFKKNRKDLIEKFRPSWQKEFKARQISSVMTYEEYEDEYIVKKKDDARKTRWKRYDQIPKDLIVSYFKKDLSQTYKLYPLLLKKIKELELEPLMNNEHKLVYALVEMENRGALIDTDKAIQLHHDFSDEMKLIARKIGSKYGKEFNFMSGKQLGEVFIKDKVKGLKYTPTRQVQTDEDALELYDHPLCKLVLRYKKCAKLKRTYCEGLLEASDNDGVIHASFKSTGAKTGRFSCQNPNLQNTPRPDEENPDSFLIRSLFIARKGFVNYYLDYKQIEYRLAADYFEDKPLIKRINNGEDLHTIQAQNVFTVEKPTKEQRSAAKTLNFAILYGAGVDKITMQLKRPPAEARDIINKFYWMNPRIKAVRNEIYKAIEETGYIKNAFGRYYFMEVEEGYKGLNYLCQGTSADIIKHAMVRIHEYIKDLPNTYMILSVHDELCIESKSEKHIKKIQELMEDFPQFEVKIETDMAMSKTSWDKKA